MCCPDCYYLTTRGELPHHNCPYKLYTCALCHTELTKENMKPHMFDMHFDKILDSFTLNKLPQDNDLIGTKHNAKGRTARLGVTGKYYCSGTLNCFCCDGICGPSKGCNCKECMILDIQNRQLSPDYMINQLGRIARKLQNNAVYCGARVLEGVAGTDGYCGPVQGLSCEACQILKYQWTHIYSDLPKEIYCKESS